VLFLQNHDQTGNRAFGERLSTLAHPAALRAAQALLLLAPQIPLLFMGEESASTVPFLYFTSHRTPELAEAVRRGRWQEFAGSAAFADPSSRARIADPNDEASFTRSVPASVGEHGDPATARVRELLALRQRHIVPHLPGCRSLGTEPLGPAAVVARWQLGPHVLTLAVNLAAEPVEKLHEQNPAAAATSAATLFDSGGARDAWARGKLPGHTFLALLEPA
jgi:maltooligosyltrehalose trehalohydrolase